jgi:hypothetical protein
MNLGAALKASLKARLDYIPMIELLIFEEKIPDYTYPKTNISSTRKRYFVYPSTRPGNLTTALRVMYPQGLPGMARGNCTQQSPQGRGRKGGTTRLFDSAFGRNVAL